jgi:hypothetical protein
LRKYGSGIQIDVAPATQRSSMVRSIVQAEVGPKATATIGTRLPLPQYGRHPDSTERLPLAV